MVAGGYAVLAAASLVLIGWWFRIEIFVTAVPGLAPMVFNTALCLALLGVGTIFVGMGRERSPVCVLAPSLVVALGGIVLVQHLTGLDFGVDEWFNTTRFADPLGSESGRMAPNTALTLVLLGFALLLRARGGRRAWRGAFWVTGATAAVALIVLVGYVGHVEPAYKWGFPVGMAVHTAVCVLLLATVLAIDLRRLLFGPSRFASWALSLSAAGILLLAVGWVAYRSLDRIVETGRDVDRAREAERTLRGLQVAVADLEARRNAFLFSGDSARPPGDVDERKRMRVALVDLQALVGDEEQRGRLTRLSSLVEEAIARDERLLERAVPASASDLEQRAELQAVLRRMLSAEAETLESRRVLGDRAVAEARGVILLGLSFVLLLGAGGVFLLRRILRELAESRGRLGSIFSSVAEGLVLQDPRGAILECNAAAERILGLSKAQLCGRDSLDPRWRTVREDGSPYPGDQHPAMCSLRDGEPRRDEIMGVHRPDGSFVWISINSEPVRDSFGGLRAVATSFFDITARRAAEGALRESEERFRNTFDHAGIGMAVVGLDGRWLRVNHAILRILGYEETELLAKTFQDITHPEDLDADLGQLRRLLAGEIVSYQMEKRYFHRAGHTVWARLTVSLVRDEAGQPRHFVSQVEDITDRKRAGEQLAAYAARLAAKNRELQDFAHVASHDLQEPLRKIQAFGDRLDQRAGARLEPDERDYLSRMRAAAARMSGLIDALLSYSRVASQARAFAPVSLDEVLQEALQDLEFRVEKTGGRVEAGPLPRLEGDAVQMRQLFQNLVGNALKYHRSGVPPLVRVSAAPAPEGVLAAPGPAWEIRVEDNGIGFEPRHAEAIFGVFHRLHGRDSYEGAGVGLAICRRIVERHAGRVRAEGRPGEGARFVVTLPAVQPVDALGA